MAARLGSDNDDDFGLNHEINVTPFIDVILVLLIIFMVAAPLATADINVQLPSANTPAQPRPDHPLYVTLQTGGALYLGNEATSLEDLPAKLNAMSENNLETKIFIRADKSVDYGSVTDLLAKLRNAGYLKLGLVGLEGTPNP